MFDVDIGQRYGVAEGGAGLAGGDFADNCAVLEDRVMAAAGAAAQALRPTSLRPLVEPAPSAFRASRAARPTKSLSLASETTGPRPAEKGLPSRESSLP
ncbi:hypothetical protein AHiyo8_23170 [Arthrobacter sp. Hiyo8]|nr:hypothetical protein AHiyo8_23170 [Arthrobacter sp. Hiyo8]